MSKIEVDENLCIGCGHCASVCPECFEIGDDGKSHVKNEACETCDLAEVAEDCPAGAISYE